MLVHFGDCCSPVPGDTIAGLLNADQGLVVHNRTCRHVAKAKYDDDIIALEWSAEVRGDFNARMKIQVENARSVLAEIANLVNHLDASIANLSFQEHNVMLSLGVRNRVHLAKIIKGLRQLKYVTKASRIINH
jgi:GTP pyrophosphokinase